MSDYIKREDALEQFDYYDLGEYLTTQIRGMLMDIPSADVAPVVRCKDCKCWTEWANGTGSCSRYALDWVGTDATDFCSFAERRNDELQENDARRAVSCAE